MVSLTSRLSGITGPLHLEETPNYLAAFVPNAGLDGHRLLCAAAMLKAIVLYQARTACLIPTGAIEQAYLRLNSELQELKEVAAEVHDFKNSLQEAQQNLAGIFSKVTEQAISAECRLRYALERITSRLVEELVGLPQTSITLLPSVDPDAVLAFLDNFRHLNDSRLSAFEAVYDLSQRLGLQVRLNENHWQLLRDGVVVAWTEGTKTRLDVCVPMDFTTNPEISVDTRLEKIKNSHIVIAGTPEKMVARLERRLGVVW
jgi:hypothetical protein